MDFEWDKTKAELNVKKHGVNFSEAATIFGDPFEITISDPDHSVNEYRYLSIGKSVLGRLIVVAYTERENSRIRIISARCATRLEQKCYESKA